MNIVAPNAVIEDNVSVGEGTKVWYFAHIRAGAKIGRNCVLGDRCYIDKGVIIGDDCHIANGVNIYEGVIIKDKVFVGNNAAFTNVRKPRAYKKARKVLDTIIEEGVTIGANATIVAGVRIGKNVMVADGAVVIGDLPDGCFAAGNPARIIHKQIHEETTHD